MKINEVNKYNFKIGCNSLKIYLWNVFDKSSKNKP